MVYIREFEFIRDDDMYIAIPFGLAGGTEGYGLEDAVRMASDWLRIHVLDALEHGREFPQGSVGNAPREGGVVIAVSVDASLSDVPAVTAAEAARRLGVSTARVAQLCKSGELASWKVGGTRMVSEDSILLRREESPKPGRPAREAMPA